MSSVFTHQVLLGVPRLLWSGSFSDSFCEAKLTEGSQLGAGRFSVTRPHHTVKERMKLYRFVVLGISSPHGQNTGPTSLYLKTPHAQCSTANTTQRQVSMRAKPASTAGVMLQRTSSLFLAALWQTCFRITSSAFTLTGTHQRKKGRPIAPAVLSRTDREKTAQVCRTLAIYMSANQDWMVKALASTEEKFHMQFFSGWLEIF